MQIDAGRENSERPTRSETDLRPPKWLARIVEALVPPELGSPNELIDVLLESHGSIAQAVLRIPVAIAPAALDRARDAFYRKMAMAQFVCSLDTTNATLTAPFSGTVLALRHTCEANTKSVRVSQGEVAQAVIPIANWHHDPCGDFVSHPPAVIHVGNHDANIRERKLRRRRELNLPDLRKR